MKIVLNEEVFSFTKHEQSRQTFAAFSKLKSELQSKPLPDINAEDVTYFLHDFKEPLYVENVVNIDLKCAYANILFIDQLITKSTFKYLFKLAKKDRLSAVGMLASKKDVFEYRNGSTNSHHVERSELAPFFFYAVKRTFEIMSELKKICGNSYLFTWVDGIYFLPDPKIKKECEIYLNSIKFPFSTEKLSQFEVDFLSRSIKVSFLKEDLRKRRFDLPMQDNTFKEILSKALILTNHKN